MIRASAGIALGPCRALGDAVGLVQGTGGRGRGLLREFEPGLLVETVVDGHPAEPAVGGRVEVAVEQLAPELRHGRQVDVVVVGERPPEPLARVRDHRVAGPYEDVCERRCLETGQAP